MFPLKTGTAEEGTPMNRDISVTLEVWGRRPDRLPLVLCGARQVGKTYALKAYARDAFESCAYVNLMDADARRVLEVERGAREMLSDISILTRTRIEPGKTIVILDEVQEVPSLLGRMKSFAEEIPEQHIACAGSYLGIALHAGHSFPVGKVEMVDMHPMSFLEFLRACGDVGLADAVLALDFDTCELFSRQLDRRLRQYYYVGGMPRAVDRFISGAEDYAAARLVQRDLLAQYDVDFSKHPGTYTEAERIRLAFSSIPAHLGRENHKFVFGHIARGARAREYEVALQWIVDSGLATRVYRVDKLDTPLRFYRDLSAFKVYLHDVGLLGAAMEVEPAGVVLSNRALEEYGGALTEQYVCQQLVSGGNVPYYWSSTGTAELDFVVAWEGRVVPVEVKAEENLRAKSLRLVHDRTSLSCVRTSMSGFREQDWLTNVPLWAVGAWFGRTSASC